MQIMIFFNSKISTSKIKKELEKDEELKFLVEKNYVVECTGNTN